MRILQVQTADAEGGAAAIALALHDGYRALGHDACVAVGRRQGARAGVLEIPNARERPWPRSVAASLAKRLRSHARLDRAGHALELVSAPSRMRNWRAGIEDFDYPGTRRLLELPREAPEVLHLHNLHGDYFDLRELPSLSGRVPTLLTLHDTWLLAGHCGYSIECERWRVGCGECPDLTIYPAIRRDATDLNFRRKRAIYEQSRVWLAGPSRWVVEKAEHSMLADAVVESRVIPNGVDLDAFRPDDRHRARQELGLDPAAQVVLFAGARSNSYKDFPAMERTAARLADGRAGEALILCAGETGRDTRTGSVEIRFAGQVGGPERMAPYYRAADVYLHSARADTFPTTVIEALACGIPVVATAVDGIPEQVEDGRNGFLVGRGDDAAMADRIARLLSDRELRARLGAAGGEDARRRFDARRMVRDYLGLYEEMLASDRESRGSSSAASSRMRSS